MTPPHVLLYTDDPDTGGVAQYDHAVLGALVRSGFQVTCARPRGDSPLVRAQAELGVRHVWLPYDPIKDYQRSLIRVEDGHAIFAKVRPDFVIFSNCSPVSHVAAREAAVQEGLPFLIVEGFAAEYLVERIKPYMSSLTRHYAAARAVIAVSHQTLRVLRERFGLSADKGQVIYYGRPERFFQPPCPATRIRLRAERGISPAAVVCLTVARANAVKGYGYLLRAILKLRHLPVWKLLHFVWIGDGDQFEELTQVVQRQNLSSHVLLLGQAWNVAEWLDAADLFVLTSKAEGMPLAIMEAMAKGLPVAATAVSGIPEQLGPTGRLLANPLQAEEATVSALVETIVEWSVDAAKRRFLGAACRERAVRLFREDRMLRETMAVIHDALVMAVNYSSAGRQRATAAIDP